MTTPTERTITAAYRTERMPSSRYGNPRYRLLIDGGECDGCTIGTTRPDSMVACGAVPFHAGTGQRCEIRIRTTASGRRYVLGVEPVAD